MNPGNSALRTSACFHLFPFSPACSHPFPCFLFFACFVVQTVFICFSVNDRVSLVLVLRTPACFQGVGDDFSLKKQKGEYGVSFWVSWQTSLF